jgi:hypothetical protein
MPLFGKKKVPKDLLQRMLDSIVEGNTYLIIPSFVFLVRTRGSFHLKYHKIVKGKNLFLEACIHGRAQLVQLSMTDSPLRSQIITQDLIDTAFLIVCAQTTPSIPVLTVLLEHGGADINARWHPDHIVKGKKDDVRVRKLKKRSRYTKRYLARYTSGRTMVKMDTPLILACRKRKEEQRTRDSTSHLVRVVAFLKHRHADHTLENEMGHDAMAVAIDTSFFRILFENHDYFDPTLSRLLTFLNRRKLEKTVDNNGFLLLLCYSFETNHFIRDLKQRVCAFLLQWDMALKKKEHPNMMHRTEKSGPALVPTEQVLTKEEEKSERKDRMETKDPGKDPKQNPTDPQKEPPEEEEYVDENVVQDQIRAYKKKQRKDRRKRIKKGGNLQLVYQYILDNKKEDQTKTSSLYCHVPDTLLAQLRQENSVVHCTNLNSSSSTMPPAAQCRMTQNEIIPLLSFVLLDAAQRGIMPNNSWTEQFDDTLANTLRNLGSVPLVSAFLHERFVPLLSTYVQHSIFRFTKILKVKSAQATIGWAEMLPMIRSLYCLMWRASKPEHPGSDEFVSAELDREIVKERAALREHYFIKLKKIDTMERIAALPDGWQFTQDVTGGYYSNTGSRKTSLERPTNVGRSYA